MRIAAGLLIVFALGLSACSASEAGKGATAPATSRPGAATSGAPSRSGTTSSSGTAPSAGRSSGGPSHLKSKAPPPSRTHHESPTSKPVPSAPLRTVTVDGQKDSYVIEVWAQVRDKSCFDHAYGKPIITYLTTHPCRGLTRLLATTVVGGRRVGIAQSTLTFTGVAPKVYSTAGAFSKLVTKDGTGNLDDLFRDGYRLPDGPPSVPSPDAFSAIGQDSGVTVVDAWYLDGATPGNDPPLVQMAQDIFLQL